MRENLIEMKSTTSNFAGSILADDDDLLTCYLRKITKTPALSMEEEKELARLAQEGDFSAKKRLVEANLKLVITIAKKAIHVAKIPMIDLIQEGNLGLMVAVEKFNWKLGYKFSTYASWWIKQAMFKAISEQGHCMKIPVYVQETLSKFSKVKAELEKTGNKNVTTKEVANKMNIEPEKIDAFLSAYTSTVSIEGSFDGKDGSELSVADVVADNKATIEENIEYEELKKDISQVISALKEREQTVIKMRFGLENFAKTTLEDIGKMYGVTKECIRQTEMRALNKLKSSISLSCYANN